MAKWLIKCLVLLTGICLALAFFEIHGEKSENTFFDHDDTYIHSNNQTVELSTHLKKENDLLQELDHFSSDLFTQYTREPDTRKAETPPNGIAFHSQQVFLRNSVLRI